MSRHLRLVAAVAVVLVAVSGFSPARKGGGHRSSGGGCSSSSSSSHNNSGSGYHGDSDATSGTTGTTGATTGTTGSSYGSDDDRGTSGGAYRGDSRHYHSTTGTNGSRNQGSGTASATVKRCAEGSTSEAKAVVEVRNPKRYTKTYEVKVEFLDGSGPRVDTGTAEVRVGSRSTGTVEVRMRHPERLGDVRDCRAELVG